MAQGNQVSDLSMPNVQVNVSPNMRAAAASTAASNANPLESQLNEPFLRPGTI